jgi:hypothetical protein
MEQVIIDTENTLCKWKLNSLSSPRFQSWAGLKQGNSVFQSALVMLYGYDLFLYARALVASFPRRREPSEKRIPSRPGFPPARE